MKRILGLTSVLWLIASAAFGQAPDGWMTLLETGKPGDWDRTGDANWRIMPKAGGRWNVLEIVAQGSHLVVILNGQKTVDIQDGKHAAGPLALQYGQGVVKFRKVQIRKL